MMITRAPLKLVKKMRTGHYANPSSEFVKFALIACWLGLCLWNSPCSAQKQPLLIQGRVEEIVRNGSLPPVVLQKQTPKYDSPVLRATGAVDTGYPSYLLGRWGGKLRVIWSANAPDIDVHFPQDRIGNIGSVVFHFDNVGGKIKLLPTVVFFPVEHEKATDELIAARKISAESLDALRQRVRETGVFTSIPTTCLAVFKGQGLSGEKFQTRPIYD